MGLVRSSLSIGVGRIAKARVINVASNTADTSWQWFRLMSAELELQWSGARVVGDTWSVMPAGCTYTMLCLLSEAEQLKGHHTAAVAPEWRQMSGEIELQNGLPEAGCEAAYCKVGPYVCGLVARSANKCKSSPHQATP